MALIGCGAVARICHLPALRRVPRIDLAYLYDAKREIAEETARRAFLTNVKIAESIDEILDDSKLSSVLIATPPATHSDLVIRSAEKGKHVFIEKPFVTSIQEAEKCKSIVQSNKIKLQIGFNLRFSRETVIMTDLIKRGVLGTITNLEYCWHSDIKGWPSLSGFQYSRFEGGVVFDMGCHLLDLSCFWLGNPSLVKGIGRADVSRTYIENATVTLCFSPNVTATLSVGWAARKPIKHVQLTGTYGTAELQGDSWRIVSKTRTIFKSGEISLPCASPRTSYENELSAFADCVASNKDCSPGLMDAIANTRLLDLVQRNLNVSESRK